MKKHRHCIIDEWTLDAAEATVSEGMLDLVAWAETPRIEWITRPNVMRQILCECGHILLECPTDYRSVYHFICAKCGKVSHIDEVSSPL